MGLDRVSTQRSLLFHSSFTCMYFATILLILKFNEGLYNVGTFKFMPVLAILMSGEIIKLVYFLRQNRELTLGKIDTRQNFRIRRPWLRGLKELIRFFVIIFILFVVYYVIIVLFGAPFLSHHEETSTLGVTLATLTFFPTCLHLGIDTAFFILTTPRANGVGPLGEAISLNIKTTLLGAWMGAIVIPLDWNRPWQVWPVPCVLGALFGYTFGHLLTLLKVLLVLRRSKKPQR